MRVLTILRAEQFSPHAVEKDRAIMAAVAERLQTAGCQVTMVGEDHLPTDGDYSLILSMGRRQETLRWLSDRQVPVINAPQGVARCSRRRLAEVMRSAGIPMPPDEGPDGYWLKRGDVAGSIDDADVCYAADRQQLEQLKTDFCRRGISDYTVSSHVRGREVKFYGVGTRFFRCYDAKGGADISVDGLTTAALALSSTVGVSVFGGDCIVRPDGTFCIIDFNDWSSFARCREEAADAIAALVKEMKSK